MDGYLDAAVSSIREAAVISGIDVVVSLAALLILGYYFFDTFGLILLVEGAVLLLVGGALGFAGQPGVRRISFAWGSIFGKRVTEPVEEKKNDFEDERRAIRANDVRAAFYMITGMILFFESFSFAILNL